MLLSSGKSASVNRALRYSIPKLQCTVFQLHCQSSGPSEQRTRIQKSRPYGWPVLHRVRKKGTDSILAVTLLTNLDNFSLLSAWIILTIRVTDWKIVKCPINTCKIMPIIMKSCLNLSKLRRKYCRYPFYGPSFVFQYGNAGGGTSVSIHLKSRIKIWDLRPPSLGPAPLPPPKSRRYLQLCGVRVCVASQSQRQQKLVPVYALSPWQRVVVGIPQWRHVIGGDWFVAASGCCCWQRPDDVIHQPYLRLPSQQCVVEPQPR